MGSYTRFKHGEWESDPVTLTCGVKQVNLHFFSPYFNFLVNVMLRLVPIVIAINMDSAKENVISFADDTVLLSSKNTGLQTLIDCVTARIIGLQPFDTCIVINDYIRLVTSLQST